MTEQGSNWLNPLTVLSAVVGIVTQALFLPCLCSHGDVLMAAGSAVSILIGLRILGALIFCERNWGWVVYSLLWATSAAWVHPLVGLVEILEPKLRFLYQ